MSQHDFNIANQTFPSFRSDLNDALQAAATISAGASAPTTPYPYQLWFDTTTDTWKVRNSGNTTWISTITTDLATGNVGIGTSLPVSALTVEKGNVTGAGQWASSAIALTNPTNIGAYSQIGFGYTPSQTNASSYIGYVSTNQGASGYGDLVFGTRAVNTDTQPSERMRIDSSGNVLIGMTGPNPYFTSTGTAFTGVGKQLGIAVNAGFDNMFLCKNGDFTAPYVSFWASATTSGSASVGSVIGTISTNGSSTAYNTSSDYRLKENVTDADDAGSKIDAIQVRQFDWIADGSHQDYGMIAQELQTVAPEAVSGNPDGDEMMGVDYSKLVPMLIKEVQSLRARVVELENN
jgi:hypothetical protein